MNHSIKKLWNSLGPILLSALSFLVSYYVLSQVFYHLFPLHSLLDNRGVGKFAFSFMVLYQIALFLFVAYPTLFAHCVSQSLQWMHHQNERKQFLKFCLLGIMCHCGLLCLFYFLGYATVHPSALVTISLLQIAQCSFATLITFGLAWSEETIFRGFLYRYFRESFPVLLSIVLTSLCFMFAHAVTQPWVLVSSQWKLGLGLFLLGMVLNALSIQTGSLASSIGFHMGIVMVKVILRRIPFITLIASPYLVTVDVRQSLLTHLGLGLLAILLFKKYVPSK